MHTLEVHALEICSFYVEKIMVGGGMGSKLLFSYRAETEAISGDFIA